MKIEKGYKFRLISILLVAAFLCPNPACSSNTLRLPLKNDKTRLIKAQKKLLSEKYQITFLSRNDALLHLKNTATVPLVYTEKPIAKNRALKLINKGEGFIAEKEDGTRVLVSISTDPYALTDIDKYDRSKHLWDKVHIDDDKEVLLYQQQSNLRDNIFTQRNPYAKVLVENIPAIIKRLKDEGNSLKRIAEIGTGRGLISIVFAELTPATTRVVAVDKEKEAVERALENAKLNGVEDKIEGRVGNLLSALKSGEKFDLIVFDLPLIPRDMKDFPDGSPEFEKYTDLKSMFGGVDGRYYIDYMIERAYESLNENGAIIFTHPDFTRLDWTTKKLAENGLTPWHPEKPDTEACVIDKEKGYIGALTNRLKPYIEKRLGFEFPEDKNNFIFNACVVGGLKKTGQIKSLFWETPVETYDFPKDFEGIEGLNPIKLWFEAFDKVGLKDKVIVEARGSMVQSSLTGTDLPFWTIMGDIDLAFYIDSDDPYPMYSKAQDALIAIMEERKIPWGWIEVYVGEEDYLRRIQLGSGEKRIHFETEFHRYNELAANFLGPFYKYYGENNIVGKTNKILNKIPPDEILSRLNSKYDTFCALLNLKVQELLLNNINTKPLKVLAWFSELRGLSTLKEEILNKILDYEKKSTTITDEKDLCLIRDDILFDVAKYSKLLVPSDSMSGKIVYNSLANLEAWKETRFKKNILVESETQTNMEEVIAQIKKHYTLLMKDARFGILNINEDLQKNL
ncbi:MAG: class I SAM-dependent methyltransferase [Candidatus Gorgyraea atricola]|nr:class I SAM-dependent methyltransferase [Candidatus Gorgyraea atricola]